MSGSASKQPLTAQGRWFRLGSSLQRKPCTPAKASIPSSTCSDGGAQLLYLQLRRKKPDKYSQACVSVVVMLNLLLHDTQPSLHANLRISNSVKTFGRLWEAFIVNSLITFKTSTGNSFEFLSKTPQTLT